MMLSWVGFKSLRSLLIWCYFRQMIIENRLIYSQIITSRFAESSWQAPREERIFRIMPSEHLLFTIFLLPSRSCISLEIWRFFSFLGVFNSENSIDHRSLSFIFKFTWPRCLTVVLRSWLFKCRLTERKAKACERRKAKKTWQFSLKLYGREMIRTGHRFDEHWGKHLYHGTARRELFPFHRKLSFPSFQYLLKKRELQGWLYGKFYLFSKVCACELSFLI